MVEAITKETAEKVVDALCERVGALRIRKTGNAWSALGLLFDGLKLVGLAVPSGRQVVQEYAQTVPLLPGVKTPVSGSVVSGRSTFASTTTPSGWFHRARKAHPWPPSPTQSRRW